VGYSRPPLGALPFLPAWDVGTARVRTDPILRPSEVEMVTVPVGTPELTSPASAGASAAETAVATCAPPPSAAPSP
jgi:hypothetical protein